MATTTFSGPIKAGTIREGASANVGFVVMAQSAVIDIVGASSLNQEVAVIPANSQIVDVILNVTTESNDGTAATVAVGTSGDADAFVPLVRAGGVPFDVDAAGGAELGHP